MYQNQVSRRHHYIPEFYTKRWADKSGRLTRFHKPNPHSNKVIADAVHPKQTGWQDKLYALQQVPDDLSDHYEKTFFRPVDTQASVVLGKMERGYLEYTVNERVAWARFVLSMVFRNPERIEAAKKRLAHDITVTSKKSERRYRSQWQPGQPPTLRKAMIGMRESGELQRLVLQTLTSTTNSETIVPLLANLKWGRIDFDLGVPPLLTSDRPLIWERPLEDPHCMILMPTGPKSAFYACKNEDDLRAIDAKLGRDWLANYMNESVVRMAQKYVYALGKDQLSNVQNFMGVNPPTMIPDLFGLAGDRRHAGRFSKRAVTLKLPTATRRLGK